MASELSPRSQAYVDAGGYGTQGGYGNYVAGGYYQPSQQVDEEDPFAKYQNAFSSIVPPVGTLENPVTSAQPLVVYSPAPSETGDPDLDKYRQFLRDQFIDPDTIGGATLDRSQGSGATPKMTVPTVKQQYAAVDLKDQENKREGELRRAAQEAMAKGRTDLAIPFLDEIRNMNAKRGGSAEERLKYYMGQLYSPRSSANGFKG
jgi:hypothetical protein